MHLLLRAKVAVSMSKG